MFRGAIPQSNVVSCMSQNHHAQHKPKHTQRIPRSAHARMNWPVVFIVLLFKCLAPGSIQNHRRSPLPASPQPTSTAGRRRRRRGSARILVVVVRLPPRAPVTLPSLAFCAIAQQLRAAPRSPPPTFGSPPPVPGSPTPVRRPAPKKLPPPRLRQAGSEYQSVSQLVYLKTVQNS